MSKALYRQYRPKKLTEVVGQEHITDILAKAIKQNSLSHAYLLTGPRGVGKTSIARIMAHEINKLPYQDEGSGHLDIIEIDAASNNGVEDIRDLREKAKIAPVSAPKKIYIIDEVHMLSKAAFNALLKSLEEPPAHVIFILATTSAEKLPITILSRVQRFNFRLIKPSAVVNHLKKIAKQEKIKISEEALQLIAQRGEGSFRDSINLLDQLSNLTSTSQPDKTISAEDIENVLGLAPQKIIQEIIDALDQHDPAKIIEILNNSNEQGLPVNLLIKQLTESIYQLIPERFDLLDIVNELINIDLKNNPEIKLLYILCKNALPKTPSKTAALKVSTETISVPIAKKTYKTIKSDKTRTVLVKQVDFNADKLIDYARQNHVAIYSVLAKCHYRQTEDTLFIYTGNQFYKKKLDDSKYRPIINQCLEATGGQNLNINTVPTAPPPKSSQIATVVAIMGGGEEVPLESL